ncbi:unnamed protein product [Owenia fusiformis]|uniref:Presequence protease, mitochondrial n=1 Tax=Owenia fusiformis TaxID=6347 RepID=A0A8J1XR48_OWEFU|nr:unnamed protein product [Owenia fusiformis]
MHMNNCRQYLRVLNRCAKVLCRRYKSTRPEAAAATAVNNGQINLDLFKPGSALHGYTVQEVVPVPELHLTAVMLTHDRTGAKHFHVARDDTNNVFSVAFRTTPMDSTGVPHILEHTTLCGSEKFPVRDPFFKMLNRSMSTFMNAFTASDWTMYPFSTQNEQDFQNLLSIYLDAVFKPRLRELDFCQEGWRLEHEITDDPSSPIVFKGVVFNEMKGVFSNPQHLFCEAVQNHLMPSHTYSVVSGGDPIHIPDLTWSHLKDFHASHYHPSNSRFYTYGDMSLEHHLKAINEGYLQHFNKIDPKTEVPSEPRWSEMREARITCRPDPMAPDPEKQTTVAVNYLLGDITDTFEAFTLNIVCHLLVHGEKSPFYQSLLEANIGSDYSPVIGYNGYTKESSFSVGLQNIAETDVDKVCNIVETTLDDVIKNGFDEKAIEGVLHRIELGQKHQSANFGFNIGMSIVCSWNHNGDPIEVLQINKHVTRLKQCLEDNPRFLQDKLQQYLKSNKHTLTVTMTPDEQFEAKSQEEEQNKLSYLVSQLSESDKEEIYKKGLELAKVQMAEEDLSCLPTLRVADIDKDVIRVHTDIESADGVPVQLCEQPTNGVTYFRAVVDTQSIPADLRPFLKLFTNVVTSMGAGGLNFKDLAQEIELKTGGMSASNIISDNHSNLDIYEQGILFSSHCLDQNIEAMFNLWGQIFNSLDLSDMNRLTTLVRMCSADMAGSIADQGHALAMTHAASYLSPSGQLKEQLSGMTQVMFMKTIAEMEDLTPIVGKLKLIAQHVLNKNNIRCALNAGASTIDNALKESNSFLQTLPGDCARSAPPILEPFSPSPCSVQYELPFSVNYMARVVRTVPYTHEHFAPLRILSRLMSAKYLHREIREKGGAYGGGAGGGSPGSFSFYSYRDPNSMLTLERFDKSVQWAKEGGYKEQDIEEAKLSVFQQLDKPVSPGDQGMTPFLSGIDDDMRQTHRDQLFSTDKQQIQFVAEKYLSNGAESATAFLGPANETTAASSTWTIKKDH